MSGQRHFPVDLAPGKKDPCVEQNAWVSECFLRCWRRRKVLATAGNPNIVHRFWRPQPSHHTNCNVILYIV